MAVLPDSHNALIQFFETRIDDWALNAAAIGLSAEQLAQLNPLILAARESYDAAQSARLVSKGATETANTDRTSLRSLGGDLINTIKAFAESSGDPSVYVTAQVPAPKTPTPMGRPDAPDTITHTVETDGSVVLRWDGTRAGGTTWVLERSSSTSVPGEYTPWAYLGAAAERTFTDPAMPAGATEVRYRIQAMRNPAGKSPWSSPHTVVLGVGASSQQQSGGQGLSLAA